VFQDFAPSPYQMQYVLAPLLERMGVWMALRVVRASNLGVLKDVIAHGKQILQIALLLLRIAPVAPMQQPLRPGISYRLRHACPPWPNRSLVQHLHWRCCKK
jgi:hypothetical protein